jgi:hypothetical protein
MSCLCEYSIGTGEYILPSSFCRRQRNRAVLMVKLLYFRWMSTESWEVEQVSEL